MLKEIVLKSIEKSIEGTHLSLMTLTISRSKIEVILEGLAGVDFTESTSINRAIHEDCAIAGLSLDNYEVEVGSAGIDKPILSIDDFKKIIGRKISVLNEKNKSVKGTLVYCDKNGNITLQLGGGYNIKYDNLNINKVSEAKISF